MRRCVSHIPALKGKFQAKNNNFPVLLIWGYIKLLGSDLDLDYYEKQSINIYYYTSLQNKFTEFIKVKVNINWKKEEEDLFYAVKDLVMCCYNNCELNIL